VSVSPLDRQQQWRLAGLLLSASVCSPDMSTAAGAMLLALSSKGGWCCVESQQMGLDTDLLVSVLI